MKLTINDDDLKIDEVQELSTKVRGMLIDSKEQILVVNFDDIVLLPGGKVENGENEKTAIIRELREEIGSTYTNDELSYMTSLYYFQRNYPKVTGGVTNRLVQTHYFYGNFKGINLEQQRLEQYEKDGNFNLDLILIFQIEDYIQSIKTNNPRSIYFIKEILTIINFYKRNSDKVKKIGSK